MTQETIKEYTRSEILKSGPVEEEQMLQLGDLAPLMSIFIKTQLHQNSSEEKRMLSKYNIGKNEIEFMRGKIEETKK